MPGALLGGMLGLLGMGRVSAGLGAVQAAGEMELNQATNMMQDNITLRMQLATQVNQASRSALISSANSGKYAMLQSANTAFYDAQQKAASKWLSVLSG